MDKFGPKWTLDPHGSRKDGPNLPYQDTSGSGPVSFHPKESDLARDAKKDKEEPLVSIIIMQYEE